VDVVVVRSGIKFLRNLNNCWVGDGSQNC
jgi:hypothetical protein